MIEFKYKKHRISISETTMDIILKHRQVNNNSEAGGMLIGSIVANSNKIEINDCTEPLKEDNRHRFGFKRSNKHNEILNKKWCSSSFTKLYLGEWHTHPQEIPSPSFIDKSSWKTLLFKSNTESEILVFLVIGTISMDIWIGDKRNKRIERGGSYRYKNSKNVN
jgi:integrative and conjugative element protein (TIGR02256 family)